MASDVGRIAEVLANHPDWHADAGDLEVVMCRLCEWTKRASLVDPKCAESAFRAHQAEQLTAAGMGHVPTALHQAADALERQPKTEKWLYAADVIRARADRWALVDGGVWE